ncbi:MFS transporter [Brevundimonas sp.]|uniref:MFS transporter n=1 Tax=Brevundimonas sp. TaxID=1871086 RepID=UPI003D152B79
MAILTVDPTAPASAAVGEQPLRKTAWRAVMMVSLIVLIAGIVRLAFSPVQEAAKLELGLSDYQISLIQGIAAALPMAIIAIPLGWLTDHSKRSRLMLILGLCWTVGMICSTFANDFASLFVARMLAGVGTMSLIPVAVSVLADLSAPTQRGRAMLFLGMGNTLGPALAFVLGGALFTAFSGTLDLPGLTLSPWRETSLVFGVVSAVAILAQFAIREPARHEVENASADLGVMLKALGKRWKFLLPLFVGQISVIMADAAAGVWAVPVMQRDLGLTVGEASGMLGGMLLLAGVLGPVIGGFVADRGHKSSLRGGILLGAVIASAVGVPAAIFPIITSVPTFAIVLFLLLAAGSITGLITATAIAVLVPNEERGVCLGAFMILGALIGLGVSPVLVTLGSQALGGEAHLGLSLAIVGVVTGAISLLGFMMAMRNAPAPVVAVEQP